MDGPPFVYSLPIDRHLCGFQFWAAVNNGAMNIYVQIFLQTNAFICLAYVLRGKIVEPYGDCMYNFTRNC